jgi:hypothetical protein
MVRAFLNWVDSMRQGRFADRMSESEQRIEHVRTVAKQIHASMNLGA